MFKIINHPGKLRFVEFFNNNNFHVILSNYGASMYEIDTVDNKGNLEAVTLSPLMVNYYDNPKYFGLTIGRVAGRIKDATFTIKGKEYKIAPNEFNNLLHSGRNTLARVFFDFDIKDNEEETIVEYKTFVKDMEDGFPGDLDFRVIYYLKKKENILRVRYLALSSKDTLLNITNHGYYNLSGNLKRDILDQELYMNKELIAKMDDELIVSEFVKPEKEFDFSSPMKIGKYMYSDAVQNTVIKGYDHIFSGKDNLYLSLSDPKSGRKMEITSDYKDVVIYTNNAGSNTGFFSTIMDKKYLGIAIEPCRYSNILKENGLIQKSNEVYDHYIEYKFSLMESPDD